MSYPDFVLGVDPGLQGAFALYQTHTSAKHDAWVWDMPRAEKKGINPYEVAVIVDRILTLTHGHKLVGVVENVNSRPRQAGAFNFGLSAGIVHGALAANGIQFDLITPMVWKGAMGLWRRPEETQDQNKDRARALAAQLFPYLADQLKRKKDDGRAEALLLASYYATRRLKC